VKLIFFCEASLAAEHPLRQKKKEEREGEAHPSIHFFFAKYC
jgi:hypothetical protein